MKPELTLYETKCYWDNCKAQVVADWVNSSGEFMFMCKEHLELCLKVHDAEQIRPGSYRVIPVDTQEVR